MIYDAIDYRMLTATPTHKHERPALPTRRCAGCGYHVTGPCAVCDQGAAVRYCAPRDLLTYEDMRVEMLRPKGKEILDAAVARSTWMWWSIADSLTPAHTSTAK